MSALLASSGARRVSQWLVAALLLVAAAVTIHVVRADAVSTLPTLTLASDPLYARAARAKPVLMLDLSVEYPTVGAAYRTTSYDNTQEYIGYFDPDGCYTYTYDATSAHSSYFRRTANATVGTTRTCSGQTFSGNFMNWATASSIDILRYALTGGDRIIDEASRTVLQRAVLQDNFFGSSSYYPTRTVTKAQLAGAVPTSVIPATGSVYINNCRNFVYFGTLATPTGSCGAPTGNTVGAIGTSPSTWTWCADDGGTCTVTGTQYGTYGVGSTWSATKKKTSSFTCSATGLGVTDPASGATGKACYLSSSSGSTMGTLSGADNFFYTRNQVCETNASTGAADEGVPGLASYTDPSKRHMHLCKLYAQAAPATSYYKPVGDLQNYSDRVRVGAFGYLMDSSDPPQRYGGVLRAPVKYVGPTNYDADFNVTSSANPQTEWNATTGVLVTNPMGDAAGNSGVINYLNKFGRSGLYKTYDPVGELYYESIRYLQGLTPTALTSSPLQTAVAGATTAMLDGFPAYSTWTDPHPTTAQYSSDYSCVRNHVIVIGDVNTWNDRTIPGANISNTEDTIYPLDTANGVIDFKAWTNVLSGFEAGTSVAYTDGNGTARTTSNPGTTIGSNSALATSATGVSSTSGYYWAGVAYWAHTHDFRPSTMSGSRARPGMRVTTYGIDVNENGTESVLATRQTKAMYLAAKYGGFDADSAAAHGNPYLSPAGVADSTVWAGSNGDPQNYFLVSDAQSVINAIDSIFAKVSSQAGSIAGGASSTTSTVQGSGLIYSSSFDSALWSGDVTAQAVSSDANGNVVLAGTNTWSAATKLNAVSDVSTRNIVVGDGAGGGELFTWATLSASQQNALGTVVSGTTTTVDSTRGQQRLAWLRGDRSLEGSILRTRGSRLGDIVNSGLAYSGTPRYDIADAGYATWADSVAARTPALFVGSNDGMLHAFNGTTGAELFAYIPSFIVPSLYKLAENGYVHQAYVDSTPAVSEAMVGSSWKTVLVSGVGGGGQGLFALDVTDPTAFGPSKVLFEFTEKDDASLGNVMGTPHIARFRMDGAEKWFVVVASGVNNYAADGYASSTGRPALFFLDLSKAAGTAWKEGVNYWKLELPLGAGVSGVASGVVDFTQVVDGTGFVSEIYAGDLHGQVWKISAVNRKSTDWENINTMSALKDSSSTAVPLFVAKSSTSASAVVQPISAAPMIVRGPSGTRAVLFGTGRFMATTDVNDFSVQSLYAVWDDLSKPDSGGRAELAVAAFSGSTVNVPSFAYGHPSVVSDTTIRTGWVADLPEATTQGERQVSAFSTLGSKVLVSSVEPGVGGCATGGGHLYVLDALTGDGVLASSTVGIMGTPFVLTTVRAETSTDSRDKGVVATHQEVILHGSSGLAIAAGTAFDTGTASTSGTTVTTLCASTNLRDTCNPSKRTSWRRVENLDDLRRISP